MRAGCSAFLWHWHFCLGHPLKTALGAVFTQVELIRFILSAPIWFNVRNSNKRALPKSINHSKTQRYWTLKNLKFYTLTLGFHVRVIAEKYTEFS